MQNCITYLNNTKEIQVINLPVEAICMAKYQKSLNKTRAAKIAENYNPHRMRPIEVSYRNGRYWCFDGQHRLAAHKMRKMESIPAIVHTNLSYEDEARLFAEQQENVGTVQTHHKWKALVEANDEKTMRLIEIAKKYGFEIGGTIAAKGKIVAIKTIQDITNQIGFEGFGTTLRIISSAWKEEDKAACAEILEGLGLFLKAFGNIPAFSEERLIATLAGTTPAWIVAKSHNQIAVNSGARIAKLITSLYNRRLRIGILKDKF